MRIQAIAVLVAAACVGGCTTTGSTPATAPGTTAPAPTTTRSTITTTSGTTVPHATTTTTDRLTEIQANFEDLESRRLEAIYTGDIDAFTALFADTPYLDRTLEAFDAFAVPEVPELAVSVLDVLRDDEKCLAIWSSVVVDGVITDPVTTVLVPHEGEWRFALVSDEKGGWLCDGPHPLS